MASSRRPVAAFSWWWTRTFADGLCNSATICSKLSHSRRERSGCCESVCMWVSVRALPHASARADAVDATTRALDPPLMAARIVRGAIASCGARGSDEHNVRPMVRQQLAAQVDQPMATGAGNSGPLEHEARGFVFGGEVTNAARQVRRDSQTQAQPAATVTRIFESRDPAKHVSSSLVLRENLIVAAGADLHETKYAARSAW